MLLMLLFAVSGVEAKLACSDLTALKLPNARINSAVEVPASDSLPAHCWINGIIEKEINFELNLPADWNEKLYMGGNGGFAGSYRNWGTDDALVRGYAVTQTDTGHIGGPIDASWALDNMRRKLNFGFRAVHLTAKTAKYIVKAYYRKKISYSYFMGCSRGGGQAMIESQRYPGDFDGIIAGAPAYNWTGFGMGMVWNQQRMYPEPQDLYHPTVPNSKLPILDAAVLNLCDGIDGLEDGLIDDPRNCPFDPEIHLPICPGNEDSSDCFTTEQIDAIQAVYDGPSNSRGQIFPGYPPGAESSFFGWDFWVTDGRVWLKALYGIDDIPNAQYGFGQEIMRYLVYNDPDYDIREFDFETDLRDTALAAAILNGTSSNLTRFKKRGGKMIMYNGWTDHAITPLGTIQYYEQVLERMGGPRKVNNFLRLFMVPGMMHCSMGPGPNEVDWLTALELWVEEDIAPDRIVALQPQTGRTRPLCPYPQVARYQDRGSIDDAQNFECVEPDR